MKSKPFLESIEGDLNALLLEKKQTILIGDLNSKSRTTNINGRRLERYTQARPDTTVMGPVKHIC